MTKNLSAKQTWRFIEFLGFEQRDSRNTFINYSFVESPLLVAALKSFLAPAPEFSVEPWQSFVGQCRLHTQHMILLVELCTSVGAWLSRLSDSYGILAIPVTIEVDGAHPETVRVLQSALRHAGRKGMHVIIWASTPCTGRFPVATPAQSQGRVPLRPSPKRALHSPQEALAKLPEPGETYHRPPSPG